MGHTDTALWAELETRGELGLQRAAVPGSEQIHILVAGLGVKSEHVGVKLAKKNPNPPKTHPEEDCQLDGP